MHTLCPINTDLLARICHSSPATPMGQLTTKNPPKKHPVKIVKIVALVSTVPGTAGSCMELETNVGSLNSQ
jgi:hypothetical protein